MHYKDDLSRISLKELNERYDFIQFERMDEKQYYCESSEQFQAITEGKKKFVREFWNIAPTRDEIYNEKLEKYRSQGLFIKEK